jgi:hypothetical protein
MSQHLRSCLRYLMHKYHTGRSQSIVHILICVFPGSVVTRGESSDEPGGGRKRSVSEEDVLEKVSAVLGCANCIL